MSVFGNMNCPHCMDLYSPSWQRMAKCTCRRSPPCTRPGTALLMPTSTTAGSCTSWSRTKAPKWSRRPRWSSRCWQRGAKRAMERQRYGWASLSSPAARAGELLQGKGMPCVHARLWLSPAGQQGLAATQGVTFWDYLGVTWGRDLSEDKSLALLFYLLLLLCWNVPCASEDPASGGLCPRINLCWGNPLGTSGSVSGWTWVILFSQGKEL